MSRVRQHNEWFRKVNVRYINGLRHRDPALIEEILARPGNTMTREQLEEPYNSIVGVESSRKSCPTCGEKLEKDEFIWSWGEYINAKWRTVKHFCKACFPREVQEPLSSHTDDCGCIVNLVSRGEELPDWLTLQTPCKHHQVDCTSNDGTCHYCGEILNQDWYDLTNGVTK